MQTYLGSGLRPATHCLGDCGQVSSLSQASVFLSGKREQKRSQVNVVCGVQMRKDPDCHRVKSVGWGPQEEDDLLDKIRGAQVWVSVLSVLPFGHSEECELVPHCSSPDSELGGRSPVHTGPGKHLRGCVLLVGGALARHRPYLPSYLHQTCALGSR